MKIFITYICILLTAGLIPLRAANDTFMDYQNYNHGYCPDCNCYPCKCKPYSNVPSCATCDDDDEDDCDDECEDCDDDDECDEECDEDEDECDDCEAPDPCNPASVCGTNCGISICWIGLGIAGIATAAAIIVGSNNGSRASH